MPAAAAYVDTRACVNETGAQTHFRFRPEVYIRGPTQWKYRRASRPLSPKDHSSLASLRLKFLASGTLASRANPTLICVELCVTANSNVTFCSSENFRDGWLTDGSDKLFRRGYFARTTFPTLWFSGIMIYWCVHCQKRVEEVQVSNSRIKYDFVSSIWYISFLKSK